MKKYELIDLIYDSQQFKGNALHIMLALAHRANEHEDLTTFVSRETVIGMTGAGESSLNDHLAELQRQKFIARGKYGKRKVWYFNLPLLQSHADPIRAQRAASKEKRKQSEQTLTANPFGLAPSNATKADVHGLVEYFSKNFEMKDSGEKITGVFEKLMVYFLEREVLALMEWLVSLPDENFWRIQIAKANHPAAYFCKSLPTIKKQYQESDTWFDREGMAAAQRSLEDGERLLAPIPYEFVYRCLYHLTEGTPTATVEIIDDVPDGDGNIWLRCCDPQKCEAKCFDATLIPAVKNLIHSLRATAVGGIDGGFDSETAADILRVLQAVFGPRAIQYNEKQDSDGTFRIIFKLLEGADITAEAPKIEPKTETASKTTGDVPAPQTINENCGLKEDERKIRDSSPSEVHPAECQATPMLPPALAEAHQSREEIGTPMAHILEAEAKPMHRAMYTAEPRPEYSDEELRAFLDRVRECKTSASFYCDAAHGKRDVEEIMRRFRDLGGDEFIVETSYRSDDAWVIVLLTDEFYKSPEYQEI